MPTWLMQLQSFLIVVLMFVGILNRKKRNLHVKIMSSAIIWDILLILQIELNRSAILKASKVMTNSAMLNIHVSIAVTTVLLYGVMIYTGRKKLHHSPFPPKFHKFAGFITFGMRILTFITSFWATP